MSEDKLQETEDGYYVQNGDVLEWRWNKGHEPKVDVPKGEFDPRSADVVETEVAPPKPKRMQKPTAKRKAKK
jgi:hypothetical protein